MEGEFYRDNLEQILAFTGGKHLLNIKMIGSFTGLSVNTVKKYFPLNENGYITAATLARALTKTK